MKTDYWYGHNLWDVKRIDCFFYPNSGEYRGNMYGKDGQIIGDYATTDSCEIPKRFRFFKFE